MKSERVVSEKPTYYSSDVLVGNWLEERIGKYKKNRFKHITVYDQDFTTKHLTNKKEIDDMRNNTRIKSEYGDNISPPRITDEFPNYYDNFTTTYDLSFHYFPEWMHGSLNRKIRFQNDPQPLALINNCNRFRFKLLKYEPSDEYLNGYGNLSSRNGLTEGKKHKWGCDVLDPRRPVLSIAKTDFTTPDLSHKQSIWPRLGPVKIKCGKVTETVHKPLPGNHPRTLEANVNPITWERISGPIK